MNLLTASNGPDSLLKSKQGAEFDSGIDAIQFSDFRNLRIKFLELISIMRAAFGLLRLVAVVDLKKLFQKGHVLLYPWQMLPVPCNQDANR